MVIREANVGDAEAVAEISRRGWATAYADLLPGSFLARHFDAPLAEEWRQYLQSMPAKHTLLVAEHAGDVVGFIRFGPCEETPEAESEAEIYGFYVMPQRIGEGIGRSLLAAAVGSLRQQAYVSVVLWTFSGNGRAERFYERSGFRLDGATRPEEDSGVEETRWRAQLTMPSPPDPPAS